MVKCCLGQLSERKFECERKDCGRRALPQSLSTLVPPHNMGPVFLKFQLSLAPQLNVTHAQVVVQAQSSSLRSNGIAPFVLGRASTTPPAHIDLLHSSLRPKSFLRQAIRALFDPTSSLLPSPLNLVHRSIKLA